MAYIDTSIIFKDIYNKLKLNEYTSFDKLGGNYF